MSLGPSDESVRQKPPESAPSDELNHHPIIQDSSEEKHIPAIVSPGDDQKVVTHRALQDPAALNVTGTAALRQYWTSGRMADLNKAVDCWQQALGLTLPDSPDLPGYLNNLGIGLRNRYRRIGNVVDLEAAIQAYQQAVQITPPGSSDLPGRLNNLGIGVHDRYRRTGNVVDLEAAIQAYVQAVQTSLQAFSLGSLDLPVYLNNLGNGLGDRYILTGNMADLEAAIQAHSQAIRISPPDSPDLPGRLNNLGVGLRDRYRRTGDVGDLEAAIQAYQQAIQAIPPDSPDLPVYLNNLGNRLRDRYIRTGNVANLEAAIQAYQQAVQVSPLNSPSLPMYLNSLGIGLRDHYRRTSNVGDLEAAIQAYQQAVQASPPGSPELPVYLNSLGIGLLDRYDRTGELTDLEAAIQAYQQAVQVSPLNTLDRPMYLNSLGNGLGDRYIHTGNVGDLEAAIQAYQQAVEATPPESPDLPGYLNNLGSGLRDRYTRTGNMDDLEAAIQAYQQAVQTTPPDSPNQLAVLNSIGNGLRDRYRRTGNMVDLEAAIQAYRQAVQATASDSLDVSGCLNNLGSGLRDRYTCTGNVVDLEAAIAAWERSWSEQHFRFVTLPVAYQLGQQRRGAWVAATLVTAYLKRAKEHSSRMPKALRRALEVAEGSKSRLLTQLVGRGQLPTPVGFSHENAMREQELLAELTLLDTQELAIHGRSVLSQEEIGHLARLQRRQAALDALEEVWASMEERLGPESAAYVALRRGAAPTWQELTLLAKALGTTTALLSFFITADRGLLFLLRAGWRLPRVIEISLDEIGWDDLSNRLHSEVHSYDPNVNETWHHLLCPLLTKTQHYLRGVERLILAPSGYGHLLPWAVLAERAGWRTPAGQPLPLVTLPALSILPRLQKRRHGASGPTLVIGNPTNPHYHNLPHAEEEAAMVAQQFGIKPLLREAAIKSEVLVRFPEARLIHVAAHAFFDPDDPLGSGIVLADGVLTAREILQHRLHADLLVLSACESGQVGSLGGEELAGLSQAFLQAGVRSLLVSLWEVNDPATAALMQAFYTEWQEKRADKALALRQAMTQIQQDRRHPDWSHPHYWGAFVLMGDWD